MLGGNSMFGEEDYSEKEILMNYIKEHKNQTDKDIYEVVKYIYEVEE